MGKNTLHMVGLDSRGAIVLREKVSRGRIASRLANLPPRLIGIETELATHHVARELATLGHDVKQVPPTYAKPLVVAPPPPTPSRIGGGMLIAMQSARQVVEICLLWPVNQALVVASVTNRWPGKSGLAWFLAPKRL